MEGWKIDLIRAARDWVSVAGGEEPPSHDHSLVRAMLAVWPEATADDVAEAFALAQRENRSSLRRLPIVSTASA